MVSKFEMKRRKPENSKVEIRRKCLIIENRTGYKGRKKTVKDIEEGE